MRHPFVVVGLGELGGVFAHALLRAGHTVVPLVRATDVAALARELPTPQGVVICVGEDDLRSLVSSLPEAYRARAVLVQNELRASDLSALSLPTATTVAVWFEKKRGTAVHPVRPSLAAGPLAQVVVDALNGLGIPATVVPEAERAFVLAGKNLYILTLNIVGLAGAQIARDLTGPFEALCRRVADEVAALECALAGTPLDPRALVADLEVAIAADPEHRCAGRTARTRLDRTLRQAGHCGTPRETISEIARNSV